MYVAAIFRIQLVRLLFILYSNNVEHKHTYSMYMLSVSGVEHDMWVRDDIALLFLKLVLLISSPDCLNEGFRLKVCV